MQTLAPGKFLPHDLIQRAISGRLTAEDFHALTGDPRAMSMADQFEDLGARAFFDNDDFKAFMESNRKLPPIRGGSRENDIAAIAMDFAAAAAGTVNHWRALPYRPFQWRGFWWLYETTEANADNTLKIAVASGASATFTDIQALGSNAMGLLDTSAILTVNRNISGAASGGAAGVAVTPTLTRIAADQVLRHQAVTAGTGTVPALQVGSYGVFL